MNTTLVPVTPLRIENAHGNVTLPLESPTFVGDLNRQRCNDSELELYIQSLTPKEHKAYLIAQSHLGMSFDLCKSRGFIEWRIKHISDTSATAAI